MQYLSWSLGVALAAILLTTAPIPTRALQYTYFSAGCTYLDVEFTVTEAEMMGSSGVQVSLSAGNDSSYPPVWSANRAWNSLNSRQGQWSIYQDLRSLYNATWLGDPSSGVDSAKYPLFGSPRNIFLTLLTQIEPPKYLSIQNTSLPNQVVGPRSYFSCSDYMCPDGYNKSTASYYFDCSQHGGINLVKKKTSSSDRSHELSQGDIAGVFLGGIAGLILLGVGCCCWRRRSRRRRLGRGEEEMGMSYGNHLAGAGHSFPMKDGETPLSEAERGELRRANPYARDSIDSVPSVDVDSAPAAPQPRPQADPMDGVAIPPPAYSPNDPHRTSDPAPAQPAQAATPGPSQSQ